MYTEKISVNNEFREQIVTL